MKKTLSRSALCLIFALLPAASTPVRPLDPDRLRKIDAAIDKAIDEQRLPGAVLWVEHGSDHYWKAYGSRALIPTEELMTRDTIFDAASVTKVLATTPAVMLLVERGKIRLDEPVHSYIPEFTGDGKERITVRQLLTHTSGLPEDVSARPKWQGDRKSVGSSNWEAL